MAEHNGKPTLYMDQAEGLRRVMNNVKLYIKLLNKFRVDMKVDDLVAAASAGDYENARILVHTLKGTSANLSLTELFKQSIEVETQIKNKALNPEALERIKVCFDETLDAIDRFIKQYD